jgi:glycosyltransferase involved in cell wall biosynthesis
MDVFCLPSLSEAMPMALLEALAAGLPFVATDVGGSEEVVRIAGRGRLVRAGDVRGLVDALFAELDAGRSLRPPPGEFNLGPMVDSYLALYREVSCPRFAA